MKSGHLVRRSEAVERRVDLAVREAAEGEVREADPKVRTASRKLSRRRRARIRSSISSGRALMRSAPGEGVPCAGEERLSLTRRPDLNSIGAYGRREN
jgi:hypothetical protein